MTVFGSRRERGLWLAVIAAVTAIYSTLGLAGEIAAELRNRQLLDGLFFVSFLAIIVGVVAVARRTRPGGIELGVLVGVIAVAVMVVLRMGIPEERTHLIEYGMVAALIHEALWERRRAGRRVVAPGMIAFAATAAIGTIDECIQALLPSRVFDVIDIGFNVLAAGLAVVAGAVLRPKFDGGAPNPGRHS